MSLTKRKRKKDDMFSMALVATQKYIIKPIMILSSKTHDTKSSVQHLSLLRRVIETLSSKKEDICKETYHQKESQCVLPAQ